MITDLEIAKYHQEWWKLGVAALTPIMIAILTYFITNTLNERQSALRVAEQTLAEKQRIYASLGRDLNIVFVYVSDVGDFRSFSPSDMLKKKREVDRTFYTYRPYWSKGTVDKYDAFMKSAFLMYAGPGSDAKIRSGTTEKRLSTKQSEIKWQESWSELFTGDYDATVEEKYNLLVRSFLQDIATSQIHSGA